MFIRSFALAVLAGSVTQAFMLPDDFPGAEVAPREITDKKSVKLNCPHCPVVIPLSKHVSEIKLGRANHLELDFTIDHTPEHDRLLVNGFELYPSADPIRDVLAASQVLDKRRFKSEHHKRTHAVASPKLGFSLAIKPQTKNLDSRYELVTLELQVIEVGKVFVNEIPNIQVKLVKDVAVDRLMIAKVDVTETQNPQNESQCTTIVCKWIHFVKARLRLAKKKGCHVGQAATAHLKGAAAKAHELLHHGHGHHLPTPHHEQGSNMAHLLENVSSHILLPILIGIIAGVTVSLIGMLVGSMVVAVWRAVFRGRFAARSGQVYDAVPQALSAAEEKTRLKETLDQLPYMDNEEKEVAPQKEDV